MENFVQKGSTKILVFLISFETSHNKRIYSLKIVFQCNVEIVLYGIDHLEPSKNGKERKEKIVIMCYIKCLIITI